MHLPTAKDFLYIRDWFDDVVSLLIKLNKGYCIVELPYWKKQGYDVTISIIKRNEGN